MSKTKDKSGQETVQEKVAKFANCGEALEAAAREQFSGEALEAELKDIRERVLPAAANYKRCRELLGRILSEKHKEYTRKRIWLKYVDALAQEFEVCRRTVQNMREDAELALGAGENRLKAIKTLGYNPFAGKLAPLMIKLQNAPADETQDQADEVVTNAVREWQAAKNNAPEEHTSQKTSEEILFARAVKAVASLLSRTVPGERGPVLEKLAKEALREAEDAAEPNEPQITTAAASGHVNSGLTLIHSSTAVAGHQPEPLATTPTHPKYLGCDSAIDLEAELLAPGALGRLLRETGATRTYIAGFESIAPHAFAKFISNEVAKFPKHAFLAPTSDPEYFLEVQELLGGWPLNFWPGLAVETIDQLDRIDNAYGIRADHKWISILLPESGTPSLSEIWHEADYRIAQFALVVAGGISPSSWGISAQDEIFLAGTAHRAGCCFYSSSRALMHAFLTGEQESYDRILREQTDIAQTGKLQAIRSLHQLPAELGGSPEGAYCTTDRETWSATGVSLLW